jgi:hypothetical protein
VSFSLLFWMRKVTLGVKQLCPCRSGSELSRSLQVVVFLFMMVPFTVDLEGERLVITGILDNEDGPIASLLKDILEEGFHSSTAT